MTSIIGGNGRATNAHAAMPVPSAENDWDSAAQRVADEVSLAHDLGQVRMSKVTSLRHAFRSDTATSPDLRDVASLLRRHGVRLAPETAPRTGCVALSLSENPQVTTPKVPVVRASIWRGNSVSDEVALTDLEDPASYADAVLWFNIDVPPSDTVGVDEAAVEHVYKVLRPWCTGLESPMISDLFHEDVQPKVETYGNEDDGIRSVSVAAVIARQSDSDDPDELDGTREELAFDLVECVSGGRWLVTLWHPTRILTGPTKHEFGFPLLREPIVSRVRNLWTEDKGLLSAGDLGLTLAQTLVSTYGASHRMIERWVESWELEFFRSLGTSDAHQLRHATVEISNMLFLVGEFRRRLTAFYDARYATRDHNWYPSVSVDVDGRSTSAEQLVETLRSANKQFELLFTTIRADMDLLMLRSQGTQQEASERLQGQLAKVTALLLVPTLIAGIFGANTQLPGGGSWTGFELMVALMLMSSIGIYLLVFRKRSDVTPAVRRPTRATE